MRRPPPGADPVSLADHRSGGAIRVGASAEQFAKASLGEPDRIALLAGRPLEGDNDTSALVCSCFGVRRQAIGGAIERDALESTAEVGTCLRAATKCGSCLPEIRALLAAATPSHSAAA